MVDHVVNPLLKGKVALVAGATRGAGRAIAVELCRAGTFFYATGRSSRTTGPSELGRPETIEETGEMMRATGGDRYAEWDKKLWEHDIPGGMRMLRMGIDTHLITSAKALPLILKGSGGLVVEMTDGTSDYNKNFRRNVGFYYDLVKASVERITLALAAELEDEDCTAVAVTPGWLRSEKMLENFGVREENWRDALASEPHFCISESPSYVARGVVALAADPNGHRQYAGEVLSSAQLAKIYGVTDTDGTQPDCWRYVVEVQNPGRPATEVGYR